MSALPRLGLCLDPSPLCLGFGLRVGTSLGSRRRVAASNTVTSVITGTSNRACADTVRPFTRVCVAVSFAAHGSSGVAADAADRGRKRRGRVAAVSDDVEVVRDGHVPRA